MRAIRNPFLLALATLASLGCQSTSSVQDLRVNPNLYRPASYRARVVVDREAFVAPMVDARAPVTDASSGPFPISYVSEGVWTRPMLEMVEEIVTDELRDSGIFVGLRTQGPTATCLVVTPYLVAARCGHEEQPTGRRSLAELELRFVVHGPAQASAARPVWFDRSFREVAATPLAMLPAEPTKLMGIALRKSVEKALQTLDQSNVARSGVPMDSAVSGER